MGTIRKVKKIVKPQPTLEGAGVNLKRVFGFYQVPDFDPFLLLDHFGSDNPKNYIAGFPWHPHRGIETVTYMVKGEVEHGDSIGNVGVIQSGDVQWMTAGNGIIHQEMPKAYPGNMLGFQLWVNLPQLHKMMAPRYREISAATIPEMKYENGIEIKIICGAIDGVKGPVQDVVVPIQYMDVRVPARSDFEFAIPSEYNAFVYVFEGAAHFEPYSGEMIAGPKLALYEKGDKIYVTTQNQSVRFLLVAGKPLNEPIAWRGPIVMNTQEELAVAFKEYRDGTFIKSGKYRIRDEHNIPYQQK